MEKMPRELCLSLGAEALNSDTEVGKIMEVLKPNLAPDASGAGFRDIIAFFGLHQPHFTLGEYLSHFEMARRAGGGAIAKQRNISRNTAVFIAPAPRRRPSESKVDDSLEHRRRSVLGDDEASYASDFAALWSAAETGCPRGEGRHAQHAGAPIPAVGKRELG